MTICNKNKFILTINDVYMLIYFFELIIVLFGIRLKKIVLESVYCFLQITLSRRYDVLVKQFFLVLLP